MSISTDNSKERPRFGIEKPRHADNPSQLPFWAVHAVCFAAIWTGITWQSVAIAVAFYGLRIFGIGAGYHRYFSHKTFKTSRWFQFVLAFLAMTTAQKGVLWWAEKHRRHHKYSDQAEDIHSPLQKGFWEAHVGWIFRREYQISDYQLVADLAKYPELVWLDRNPMVPPIAMGVAAYLIGGWPGLVVGFFWSTVAVWHATFMINSLAHVHGKRRFVTGDDSRNNWFLAVLTMGEGWHNNHHAYQKSCRQGFRWWEWDPNYYAIKLLSFVGVVWDVHEPPKALLAGDHVPGAAIIARTAALVAQSFQTDKLIAQAQAFVPEAQHALAEWSRAAAQGPHLAADAARELAAKLAPSLEDVRQRAARLVAQTPSMDEIVRQAHVLLTEALSAHLLAALPARAGKPAGA